MTSKYAPCKQHHRVMAGLIISGLLMITVTHATDDVRRVIQPAELAERIDSGTAPLILDVRTPEEYAEEHIPGAINIPETEISTRLSELNESQEKEIVLYCRSGRRAELVESVLLDAGYTDIRILDGHMLRWLVDGGRGTGSDQRKSLSKNEY